MLSYLNTLVDTIMKKRRATSLLYSMLHYIEAEDSISWNLQLQCIENQSIGGTYSW